MYETGNPTTQLHNHEMYETGNPTTQLHNHENLNVQVQVCTNRTTTLVNLPTFI
jgi:hypothetical protein